MDEPDVLSRVFPYSRGCREILFIQPFFLAFSLLSSTIFFYISVLIGLDVFSFFCSFSLTCYQECSREREGRC